MNNRFDIYPAKGSFELNEAISFRIKNDGEAQSVVLNITSVESLSYTRRISVENGISTITLSDCYFPLGGYCVEAQFFQNGRMTDICFTAFDVIQPGTTIRYGFLCDFSATDDADNDVEAMLQMHVNAVQFYDWSYRHDELVAPVTDYYDMMGKHNNLATIRRKIQACHERGMKTLAYGAVYAASESYQKEHPEQSLYNSQGKPLCFINTFYIMNLSDTSAWQQHILNQYQRAMDEVGFDGIHMDTYGSPKAALDVDRGIVYLDDEFPKLIEMAHLLPLKSKKPPFLIFNNVGGWPAERTMCTNQQAVYIEVWPPYVQYYHLSTMIETAKKSGKPVILAAYPAAFRTDTPERALESQLLLSFVIGMYGATQLFFGEENAVITQGYYADYTRLNAKQIEWIRSYQDFFVQYEPIFMDRSMENVSLSHQGWDNQEYQFVPDGSADGESGKVWYHLLQNRKRKVVCIVNLSNNSSVWNEGKNVVDKEVTVSAQIQVTREPETVWAASPDYQHGKQQQLSYQLMQTEQSAVICVKLQVLRCGILVIEGGWKMAQWWKERVFYQIYPRSFQDSNADGIGDIQGIISRLDYLKWLGIGAVWLCPVYDSPNADMGYDIRDYEKIMAEFGTMEDFDTLLQEMHKRDMKLVMDLVVNHSSDEHAWFVESRKAKDNPYRDYYIWRDGNGDKEPNNWASFFTPSAWTYDDTTKQWYLHLFGEKQPDLNWENEKMRNEVYTMINRWFDKGVDGFRMDVISLLAKADGLPSGAGSGYVFSEQFFAFQPKLHSYLREMRKKCFDGRDCMCVGETTFVTTENANSVIGDGQELDMLFQFDLMDIDGGESKWDIQPFSLPKFKEIIKKWQTAVDWNTLFLGNHDQPRVVSRFGCTKTEKLWKQSAKCLATAMYLLRGTPFIYQGEELGMTNYPFTEKEQLRDIESLNLLKEAEQSGTEVWAWKGILHKGRDNARTPMQWNSQPNAGFSAAKPWIAVNPNYKQINAEAEMADEASVLHFYRELIALRNGSDTLKWGDFTLLLLEHPQIFAYERTLGKETVRVICNISEQSAVLPMPTYGKVLLREAYENRTLLPYGILVEEI